jgi:hypothetical protein
MMSIGFLISFKLDNSARHYYAETVAQVKVSCLRCQSEHDFAKVGFRYRWRYTGRVEVKRWNCRLELERQPIGWGISEIISRRSLFVGMIDADSSEQLPILVEKGLEVPWSVIVEVGIALPTWQAVQLRTIRGDWAKFEDLLKGEQVLAFL